MEMIMIIKKLKIKIHEKNDYLKVNDLFLKPIFYKTQ